MKYYSEEATKKLRLGFEDMVLHWPKVSTKKMFGCPCYQANGKLFAFLITNGVVITQLAEADKGALSRKYQTAFFQAGKKIVQNWVKLSVKNRRDLSRITPYVRKSYASALQIAG